MYSFADFDTVKELPDVLSVPKLSVAVGLSVTRTHELLDEMRIPYLRIGKRKVIFKRRFRGLRGCSVL